MNIYEWAARWRVPIEALRDLERGTGIADMMAPITVAETGNEAEAQARIRLAAAEVPGLYLFRNNVGALKDERGRLVRYGLANDTKALNEQLKSSDLIGLRAVTVTPDMAGRTIAQFVSWETKRAGWTYSATPRELAQRRWLDLVLAMGGDARFVSSPGEVS